MYFKKTTISYGLPWWLRAKESTCNAGDMGDVSLILGSGRSQRGGHGNPLPYSCLKNPTDKGARQIAVRGGGRKKSDTTEATEHTRMQHLL